MSVEELVELSLARSYDRACVALNDARNAFLAPTGLHYTGHDITQVIARQRNGTPHGNERLARERDDGWREYTAAAHRLADIGTCWRNLRLAQGLYCP